MDGDRGYSQVVQPEQWLRCQFDHTVLVPDEGVTLQWTDDTPKPSGPRGYAPAGLAFDRWCRAYRSRPDQSLVQVIPNGYNTSPEQGPGILRRPLGVAVDTAQRLYIAESGASTVHVVDLVARRLLRKVPLPCQQPVDIAAKCCGAVVLLHNPNSLVVLEGRRAPKPGPKLVMPDCTKGLVPQRIAMSAQGLLVLWRHPWTSRAIVSTVDGQVLVDVPDATDLDVTSDGTLVVARQPGQSLRRFQQVGKDWLELEPLGAPDYDGGAIAIAPTGRIAFTTPAGIGWTTGSAAVHDTDGTLITYRLDSGVYRNRWGRLFLDGCIPTGADLGVQFLTSDNDDAPDPEEPWSPQPMPLFRRPTGRETPWAQIAADDTFETYEAPVAAPPGRYLWIGLTFSGTHRVSPTVRAMRVERPGHQLLNQLPRMFSRDEGDADFLQRFLGPAEGLLHEMDMRAAQRAILLDPAATPQEALNWLAGFTGLVLDRRWPEAARRQLIAEAYPLFSRRGTKTALTRILAIYLGYEPAIVERWQLRGPGGAVLGDRPGSRPAPAVGGAPPALGEFTLGVGGAVPTEDTFVQTAHQFTVLIPTTLTSEQLAVVKGILDDHRPAHTTYELCELGNGMRVGRQALVRLTTFVGSGAQFTPAVVGFTLVGGDGMVGVPAIGSTVGNTTVTGKVRVG
jgi:phage tail-like protein